MLFIGFVRGEESIEESEVLFIVSVHCEESIEVLFIVFVRGTESIEVLFIGFVTGVTMLEMLPKCARSLLGLPIRLQPGYILCRYERLCM